MNNKKSKCSCDSHMKAKKLIEEANRNNKYFYIKGMQGPKGDKGEPGPKGDKGEPGPKGDKGNNGGATVEIGTTETVEPTENAMVTNIGTNENVILNFKIPKGIKGDKGERGDKGDIGPRGFPGEIGISEVITIDGTETIEPDEPAEVQDDFDRNIHHLTFYIPKGQEGHQGPQGEPGPQGPKGDKGDSSGIDAYAIRYTNTDQNFVINEFTEAIIPLEMTGPSLNINYNSSYAIEIQKQGIYEISYSLSLFTTTDARFNISIQVSGITVPASNIRYNSKANTVFNISNSTIHTLNENDEVTLVISSFNNTELNFDDTTNAKLSLIKID